MEEKKSKGTMVVVIILVILVLGLAGYISYDKYFYKYFKKTEVKETKTEEKNTKEEKVNGLEKDSITNLVNILTKNFGYFEDDAGYYLGANSLFNTKDKVTNKEISDEYKLYSILTEANIDSKSDYICSDDKGCWYIYSKEEVDDVFKKVYGSAPRENIKLNNSCPGGLEIENNGEFYKIHGECGSAGDPYTETYLYNVTKRNNEYYAYVAVGYIDYIDGHDNPYYYTNLEKDKYTKNIKELSDYKIDESNYKEFSKYKITFKEDSNGNYIFRDSVRIEK